MTTRRRIARRIIELQDRRRKSTTQRRQVLLDTARIDELEKVLEVLDEEEGKRKIPASYPRTV